MKIIPVVGAGTFGVPGVALVLSQLSEPSGKRESDSLKIPLVPPSGKLSKMLPSSQIP